MNILITGGSGFMGRYIADFLCDQHNLLVIGRNKVTRRVTTIKNNEVDYKYTDYSLESLNEIFNVFNPNAVLHLAAQRPVKNEKGSSLYIKNLSISLNLFQVCLFFNVTNVVNISSKSVYSEKNNLPWNEGDFPVPENEYGLSKIWVEDAARMYNAKGLRIKSLRLAQVIGLGEREGYVLQTYLQNARQGNPLKVYGKGIGKRQYIYIKDVANAIQSAIDNADTYGVFNIGMASNYSFMELAKCINKVFSNRAGIEHLSELQADETNYNLDISMAENELQWKPSFNLEDTYKDIKFDLEKLLDES